MFTRLHGMVWRIALVFVVIAVFGVGILQVLHPTLLADALPKGSVFEAGDFKVQVAITPDPPQVGINKLSVTVLDRKGLAVSNATLDAVAEMPAMGAMSTMRESIAFQSDAAGRYDGTLDLPMDGPWPITLNIGSGSKQERLVLHMSTGRAGLRPTSLGQSTGGPSQVSPANEFIENTVVLDARRRQLIGVTTAKVERKSLTHTVRTVGRVVADERRLADISLKFSGWMVELHANFIGARVRKGDPMFSVFSPELVGAQNDYLSASQTGQERLRSAARARLKLWDFPLSAIAELEKTGVPLQVVTITAPATGVVMTKNVVAGSAFAAGTQLLRLADLSHVWVEMDVHVQDLPHVKEGAIATISIPNVPESRRRGPVSFVSPAVDPLTRTARIRLDLANADATLRPDMFVEAQFDVDLGARRVTPDEAVLYSGKQRIVFVEESEGRFRPRLVKIGVRTAGVVEIVEGLEVGETVVTSGNFLIAAESRLKGGMQQW